MELERRLHEDIEVRMEGDKTILRGYAAIFNSTADLGKFTEEIRSGAFDGVLANQDVIFTYNHSLDHVLARSTSGTLKYGVDERGLWYAADVANTSLGRDLQVLIERGDITANSFAFSNVRDKVHTRAGKMHRSIEKVGKLHDISIVPRPAYKDAVIIRSEVLQGAEILYNPERYKQRMKLLKRFKY